VGNFRALVLHEEGGKVVPRLETVDESRLPAGEVTVAVTDASSYLRGPSILVARGEISEEWWRVAQR